MRPSSRCPECNQVMRTAKMACESCSVAIEGDFQPGMLMRLSEAEQRYIEAIVLSGCKLKSISHDTGLSYPTLRSRLDKVIKNLRAQLETGYDRENELSKPQGVVLEGDQLAKAIKSI